MAIVTACIINNVIDVCVVGTQCRPQRFQRTRSDPFSCCLSSTPFGWFVPSPLYFVVFFLNFVRMESTQQRASFERRVLQAPLCTCSIHHHSTFAYDVNMTNEFFVCYAMLTFWRIYAISGAVFTHRRAHDKKRMLSGLRPRLIPERKMPTNHRCSHFEESIRQLQ